MDSDGHFCVSDITNRKDTIKLLKKISDGDYWIDMAEDYLESVGAETEADLLTINEKSWKEFVSDFEQRGMMEIITLNINE